MLSNHRKWKKDVVRYCLVGVGWSMGDVWRIYAILLLDIKIYQLKPTPTRSNRIFWHDLQIYLQRKGFIFFKFRVCLLSGKPRLLDRPHWFVSSPSHLCHFQYLPFCFENSMIHDSTVTVSEQFREARILWFARHSGLGGFFFWLSLLCSFVLRLTTLDWLTCIYRMLILVITHFCCWPFYSVHSHTHTHTHTHTELSVNVIAGLLAGLASEPLS